MQSEAIDFIGVDKSIQGEALAGNSKRAPRTV